MAQEATPQRHPTDGEGHAAEPGGQITETPAQTRPKLDLAAAIAKYPELPEKPEGWTQQLSVHMSCQSKNGRYGLYIYALYDKDGFEVPVSKMGSSKRGEGRNGFVIGNSEDTHPSWAELRTAWAALAKAGGK